MSYFWWWSRKQDLKILEISESTIGPWMAGVSVLVPKKPHQSISTNYVYHQVWCQDVSSYCVLILGDDYWNWKIEILRFSNPAVNLQKLRKYAQCRFVMSAIADNYVTLYSFYNAMPCKCIFRVKWHWCMTITMKTMNLAIHFIVITGVPLKEMRDTKGI